MADILVAEDNEMNMKLMFDILTSLGHSVEKALNGEEAVTKLLEKKYDLLLLDIQMPVKNGYQVLEAINENNITIKTIVISACATEHEIERAKNLGCETFMTKPIRLNEFLNTINSNVV